MKAINYAKFINLISSSRKPSPIRVLSKVSFKLNYLTGNATMFLYYVAAIKAQCGPSMISLAGGSPNPYLFPFKEATFSLRYGSLRHSFYMALKAFS